MKGRKLLIEEDGPESDMAYVLRFFFPLLHEGGGLTNQGGVGDHRRILLMRLGASRSSQTPYRSPWVVRWTQERRSRSIVSRRTRKAGKAREARSVGMPGRARSWGRERGSRRRIRDSRVERERENPSSFRAFIFLRRIRQA